MERNVRSPLVGIGQSARRLGIPVPQVTVGVRSGDTTSSDRRKLVAGPPDILITTRESLYLLLTSTAGETLAGVDTVIIDEVREHPGPQPTVYAIGRPQLNTPYRLARSSDLALDDF
ncbi:Lhr-like helicase [Salinibacterium sp. CAN_S4]